MKRSRLLNSVVGGSYEADERIAGNAVSVNLYSEKAEDASGGTYFTAALRSVPGERTVLSELDGDDPSGQGCRGMFTASDDTLFAAFGKRVLRIRRDGASGKFTSETVYTQEAETVGRVKFCETGGVNSWVCWIDGTDTVKAYPLEPRKVEAEVPVKFKTPVRVYLTADNVENNTETNVSPTSIKSLSGCICVNDPENDTWYYTDAYILGGTGLTREIYDLDGDGNVQYEDGSYKVKTREVSLLAEDPSSHTAYLWLDRYSKPRWQTAEYAADSVTAFARCGDFLVAFGPKSMQVYSQQTSTDAQGFSGMAFSSAGRNVRDTGVREAETVVEIGGKAVFLGSAGVGERSVWSTDGGAPVRISTNAIEREFQGRDLSDSYALGYSDNGHQFYCLTVPSLRKTFCYDFSTRQWHNRSTRDRLGRDVEWWAAFAAEIGGETALSGVGVCKVAVLDRDKFDDYEGEPIVKRRTAPILMNDYSPFVVNDVQLLWNTGSSKDTDNSSGARDPVVMMDVSTDGGNTFGNERWATGGRVGRYSHRSVWYGVGMGTLFVLRFTISDRVNVVITGAKVSFTPCSHF